MVKHKNAKIIWIMFLSILFVFSLAGCKEQQSEESGSGDSAEDFPDKEVEIITTFGQGGTEDLAAHAIANAFKEETGQNMVVTNETGGSGVPGTKKMTDADSDGYTLEMVPSGQLNVRPQVQDVPYDFPDDFTPILGVGDYQLNYVAKADAPYDTVDEMVEYYNEENEEVKIGTPGANTYSEISAKQLSDETGLQFKHLPLDSGKKVASQILGGHVDVGVINGSDVYEGVEDDELKILGFPTEERYDNYPDVKTLKEEGIDIVGGPTFGVWGPADLPEDIQEKLTDIISETMESEEFKKVAESNNLKVTNTPPDEMEEEIVEEQKEIEKVTEKDE